MSYITQDFMLNGYSATRLYHDYAEDMPIFDYHCHLSERELLADREFTDIYTVWCGGDHYKWRLMRSYGVPEQYITGDATPHDKFIRYCTVVGTAFGSPLQHWSQMELEQFFDCSLEINEANAEQIWQHCNAYIAQNHITPTYLIEKAGVRHIFTTNEATDDLTTFPLLGGRSYSVAPAFRGDSLIGIDAPGYRDFLSRLAQLTCPIVDLDTFERAIAERLDAFIQVGCRAADVSVEYVPAPATREAAAQVLADVLAGKAPTAADTDRFKSYMLGFLMGLYADRGIVNELHLGPMRNNNTVMLHSIGRDTGFDAISQHDSTNHLSRLLDSLSKEGRLPRTVLFNLNPNMNTELVVIMGCFQDGSCRGKMQYGPAWWFLDNRYGMETQLRDLSSGGHLATFIGMLTDSRSFLSYARHDYFRRILCSYLGDMMDRGLMTADMDTAGKVVKDICYNNAVNYFEV